MLVIYIILLTDIKQFKKKKNMMRKRETDRQTDRERLKMTKKKKRKEKKKEKEKKIEKKRKIPTIYQTERSMLNISYLNVSSPVFMPPDQH